MKKILFLSIISLLIFGWNQASAKKNKAFEGTITYKIGMSGSPEIESAMSAYPESMKMATLNVKGSKARLSLMGQKTYVDASAKMITTQVDLTMLGMGEFCIETPFDTINTANYYKYTGETKKISGYTAEKVIVTTQNNEGVASESIVWVTKEINTDSQFPTFVNIKGMPVEFELNSVVAGFGNVVIKVTLDNVAEKRLSKDDVTPNDDCKTKTAEELQEILKVLQNFDINE